MNRRVTISIASPSSMPILCHECGDPIISGDFVTSSGCHLDCLRLVFPTKVSFDQHVQLLGDAEQYKDCLKAWFEEWNIACVQQAFAPPDVYSKNRVRVQAEAGLRTLLEIFMFLKIDEVEQSASLVCRRWHGASREKELWIHFYDRMVPGESVRNEGYPDFRTMCIRYLLHRCWKCNRLVDPSHVQFICPYHRKPFCTSCWDSKKEIFIGITEAMEIYDLDESDFDLLQVPRFHIGEKKWTYLCMLAGRICGVREKVRGLAEGLTGRSKRINRQEREDIRGLSKKFSIRKMKESRVCSSILPFLVASVIDKNKPLSLPLKSIQTS